jgi:hypothetical protein
LARAVSGRWPPIRIVTTPAILPSAPWICPKAAGFLPKPYSSMQVTGVLREVTAVRQ